MFRTPECPAALLGCIPFTSPLTLTSIPTFFPSKAWVIYTDYFMYHLRLSVEKLGAVSHF